jgi:hypothetical protein
MSEERLTGMTLLVGYTHVARCSFNMVIYF